MDVYIALQDAPDGAKTRIIGAFSTEEKARAAAQETENDENITPLPWKDGETTAVGVTGNEYDVVLMEMDVSI